VNEAPPAEALRKIIHVDMDAFYASVEQRDNPELRGKPVAVGGHARGVVAAASYEAARSDPLGHAVGHRLARCPDLIFVKPRFDAYREVSQQIRRSFLEYTPHVEPLSLDEAYLDVTEDLKAIGSRPASPRRYARGSRPRPASPPRPESPTTSSSPSCAATRTSPTASAWSLPSKGRPSSPLLPGQEIPRSRSGHRCQRWRRLGIEPEPTLGRASMDFLAAHFGAARFIITIWRAASATARSRPTARTNRSAPRILLRGCCATARLCSPS
jgi:DNA polymerase-4